MLASRRYVLPAGFALDAPEGVDPATLARGQALMSGVQSPAPAAAVVAPPPPHDLQASDLVAPAYKPSLLRQIGSALLDGLGASPELVDEVRDPDKAQRSMQVLTQRIAQAKRLFPGDEQAQTLWVTGDDDFKKSLADRYKDETVGEGSAVVRNGSQVYRNKKTTVGVSDGYGYHGDDENGVTFDGQRGKTHAEEETSTHNRAEEGLKGREIDVDEADKADDNTRESQKVDPTQEILRKAANGQPLNPAEQTIFDAEIERRKKGDGFNFGLPPQPAKPPPAPGPGTGSGNPAAAPRRQLPAAGTVVQNGWVYKVTNGKVDPTPIGKAQGR